MQERLAAINARLDVTESETARKQTLAGQPRMGARAERRRTTSMRDVEMFTEMTGDRNPIHYDADLAAD